MWAKKIQQNLWIEVLRKSLAKVVNKIMKKNCKQKLWTLSVTQVLNISCEQYSWARVVNKRCEQEFWARVGQNLLTKFRAKAVSKSYGQELWEIFELNFWAKNVNKCCEQKFWIKAENKSCEPNLLIKMVIKSKHKLWTKFVNIIINTRFEQKLWTFVILLAIHPKPITLLI